MVAVDKRSGKIVNGYDPADPNIIRQLEKTGWRVVINLASPGRPHQSFLHGLHIPSREPAKPLF